jgi:hypothetical protein
MFLYTISLLLKREHFDLVLQLMSQEYYVGDTVEYGNQTMQPFGIFWRHLVSLDHRNQRLKLRRLSLQADMLKQRSHTSGLTFNDLMQADFILFFYDAITSSKGKRSQKWVPETLLYYDRQPLELLARANSKKYFERIKPLLAVDSKDELGKMFKLFGSQGEQLYLPRWQFHSVSLVEVTNFEKLSTRP